VKFLEFETRSEEETIALGTRLAGQLPSKATVLLIGNLGAGKTTLAKGMVQGRNAAQPEEVSSPTFTLIHEYGSAVYHIDLYRLDKPEQVANLGLDEIFERDALVLVEWGERFPNLMPNDRFEIRLTPTGENSRRIEVTQPLPQPLRNS
jgi:tRNA threonylcarbamoyladenosine biosynthesis protein TsaE